MNNVYVLFGLPGVGKSTVLNNIKDEPYIEVFDVDDFIPSDLKEDISDGKLVDKDRWAEFHQSFLETVAERSDKSVTVFAINLILDEDREAVKDAFPKATWIHLSLEKDKIKNRLKARKNHFFNKELFETFWELHYPIDYDHYDIAASKTQDQITSQIKDIIDDGTKNK